MACGSLQLCVKWLGVVMELAKFCHLQWTNDNSGKALYEYYYHCGDSGLVPTQIVYYLYNHVFLRMTLDEFL